MRQRLNEVDIQFKPPISDMVSAQQLLDNLARLSAEPDGDAFDDVMDQLQEAVFNNHREVLDDLHALVSLQPDSGIHTAFDSCIDLLCTDSEEGALLDDAVSWKCMALNVLAEFSSEVEIRQWTDTHQLQRHLAQCLGVSTDDVFVDLYPMTCAQGFTFGPLQAYRHCQLVRARASGINVELLKNIRCNVKGPIKENPLGYEEFLVMVAFRLEDEDDLRFMDALDAITSHQSPLKLRADEFEVRARVIDAAPPWTGFTCFVHEAQAGRVLTTISQLLDQGHTTLRTYVAGVQVEETGQEVLRLSVLDGRGNLVGAISETNLAEPDIYLTKVDRILSGLGLPAAMNVGRNFKAASVDEAGAERFWVPPGAWVRPPAEKR